MPNDLDAAVERLRTDRNVDGDCEYLADAYLRLRPPGPRPKSVRRRNGFVVHNGRIMTATSSDGSWCNLEVHYPGIDQPVLGTGCKMYPTESDAKLALWWDRWEQYLAFAERISS